MRISDWSSDVCSSDLIIEAKLGKITLCVFVPRIIKKRHEFIVLFEMEGVIGMAMTLYAGKSSALPYFPGRVYPVNDRRHPVFFAVGTPFVIVHRIPVESCGHQLISVWVGKQVAGQLLDGKLVKRFVFIKGLDHPVPVPPYLPGHILFEPLGIGITGHVKTPGGHTFSKARGSQE